MPVTHALSNLAGAAATSMQAVELWLDVIADNMSGSPRVGFRRSEVTFRGSGVSQTANNLGGGVPKAEVVSGSLQVATTIKVFEEGKVNSSFSDTHFAITGSPKVFFVLTDAVSGGNRYYTRDGEFVLTTVPGLGRRYVHVTSGLMLSKRSPASAVSAGVTPTSSVINNVDTFFQAFLRPEQLTYSAFGTTVFNLEATAGTSTPSGFNPKIINRALESSNTSITLTIPQLTLAQKMFSAFAKIISSDNDNTDTVLQLVR